MNSFVNALKKSNSPAYTFNDALTLPTSGMSIVDLFFLCGASRGKDITKVFDLAYKENKELALRTALYTRDIRQGVGERKVFRDMLLYVEKNDPEALPSILPRVPDLGRWDDLLIFEGAGKDLSFEMIRMALFEDEFIKIRPLVAKWMPRKGKKAVELREYFGMSPRQYRKYLVNNTNVVETKMCSKEWGNIVYDHVPSVASARYRKAFFKHDSERYAKYVEELTKPETAEKPRKVNAAAIYPHDVIHQLVSHKNVSKVEKDHAEAQWKAMPDFIGEGSFIPMIDVSESMTQWNYYVMNSKSSINATPMDIALALGIYVSERNKSAFKNVAVAFTDSTNIVNLNGTILDKIGQLRKRVGYSTNISGAISTVLTHAINHKVPAEEMPKALLIISDMEFDSVGSTKTNYEVFQKKYKEAGYEMPKIVFWNLNGRTGNSPVTFDNNGVALVSGFSPSVMKNVLANKNSTPLDTVLETIMNDRYKLV